MTEKHEKFDNESAHNTEMFQATVYFFRFLKLWLILIKFIDSPILHTALSSANWGQWGFALKSRTGHYTDVIMTMGGVLDNQPHDCLLSRLFRRRSKKTSKLRVTGLCVGNSQATGEFPAQRPGNAENVSISWRHHEKYQGLGDWWVLSSL